MDPLGLEEPADPSGLDVDVGRGAQRDRVRGALERDDRLVQEMGVRMSVASSARWRRSSSSSGSSVSSSPDSPGFARWSTSLCRTWCPASMLLDRGHECETAAGTG